MSLRPPLSSTSTFVSYQDLNTDLDELAINVKASPYNAVGNGVADDTTAIQAAITALPTQGGTVFFPPGAYLCSGTLTIPTTKTVKFQATGGRYGGSHTAQTRLEYSGTGTFINAASTYGFSIDSLYIYAPNLGASGVMVNLDRSSTDTVLGNITNCWLRGTNNGTGVLVSLKNAWGFKFESNFFWGAGRAIRGRVVGGTTDFSNSISVIENIFEYSASHPILNPFQSWKIERNIFEPIQSTTGPAGAIECQSGFAVQGIVIRGNSFQDATTSGTWIKDLRGNGADISGNFFYSGDKAITFAGEVDPYFVLDTAPFTGARVEGNLFGSSNTTCIGTDSSGVISFEESGNFYHVDFAGGKKEITGVINADLGGIIPQQNPTAVTGATWPVANRAIFTRYVPTVTHTATGIAFHCSLADAGSPNGDVAVLDSSRNRLASSGSVSCVATTGIRYIAFTTPIVLRKGVIYYVGMGLVSATAQVGFTANYSTGTQAELISSSTPHVLQWYRDSSVPIADPAGAITSTSASCPYMAVRTA